MSKNTAKRAVKGRVFGRVQGVGFRYFVRKHALELGLSGSAMNLADGSVEIIVTGDELAIEKLQTAVSKGPALSYVASVEWDAVEVYVAQGFVIG